MRGRQLEVLLAGALVVLAMGCSGGDDDTADPAGDPSPGDASALDPAQAAVVEDYEAYWVAFLGAADPPAPESEELAARATGEELERARLALTAHAQAGEVVRGSYAHDPRQVAIDGSEAQLSDCLTANTAVHDASTGELEHSDPADPQALLVSLERTDDVWKVTLIDRGTETCSTPPG